MIELLTETVFHSVEQAVDGHGRILDKLKFRSSEGSVRECPVLAVIEPNGGVIDAVLLTKGRQPYDKGVSDGL
jgi:hypothetical protein